MVKGSCKLCLFPKSLRGVAQFGVYNKGGNEMQDPCPFRLTMADGLRYSCPTNVFPVGLGPHYSCPRKFY